MKQNQNKMAIFSFVALIICIVISLFWPSVELINLGLGLSVLFGLIAVILGFVAKKQIKKSGEKGKGLALTSIILGIIISIYTIYTLIILIAIQDITFSDQIVCPDVTNCKDNGDGTSTCEFEGLEIPCSTDKLNENQFEQK